MPSRKDIMNNVRHKERHRREVVDSVLEVPIGGSEDQGSDSLLSNIKQSALLFHMDCAATEKRKGMLTLSVAISDFSNR